MKIKPETLFLSAAVLMVAVLISPNLGRSGVFKGRYVGGLETSRFVECGSKEQWWVTGNDKSINGKSNSDAIIWPSYTDRHGVAHVGGYGAGYIEVQGRATWRNPIGYGHMNKYARELDIQQVLVAQRKVPDSCH